MTGSEHTPTSSERRRTAVRDAHLAIAAELVPDGKVLACPYCGGRVVPMEARLYGEDGKAYSETNCRTCHASWGKYGEPLIGDLRPAGAKG
jgi:cytochrome c5